MATKYPIGIQSFETIISDGYAYVDKTEYIHNLAALGKYFSLVVRAVSGSRFCFPPSRHSMKGRRNCLKVLP